jgi:hypothetical protein
MPKICGFSCHDMFERVFCGIPEFFLILPLVIQIILAHLILTLVKRTTMSLGDSYEKMARGCYQGAPQAITTHQKFAKDTAQQFLLILYDR